MTRNESQKGREWRGSYSVREDLGKIIIMGDPVLFLCSDISCDSVHHDTVKDDSGNSKLLWALTKYAQ